MTNLLFEFDKRQAEWVVVAYLGQDARMIEVHKDGLDPHTRTGYLISGVPEHLIRKEHKLIGHNTDAMEIESIRREKIPELFEENYFLTRTMSIRQAGKKSNHGLNYDMHYNRFALENEMDNQDAKHCVEAYLDAYPGVPAYHKWVKRELEEDRTLTSCFGDKRRFLGPWGDELFREAYSHLPQNTVVRMVNQGMNDVYYSKEPCLKPIELRIQVHDSLGYQSPIKPISRVADMCIIIDKMLTPMINYHGRDFQIETDLKIGPNLGHMIEVSLSKNKRKMIENLKKAYRELEYGGAKAA